MRARAQPEHLICWYSFSSINSVGAAEMRAYARANVQSDAAMSTVRPSNLRCCWPRTAANHVRSPPAARKGGLAQLHICNVAQLEPVERVAAGSETVRTTDRPKVPYAPIVISNLPELRLDCRDISSAKAGTPLCASAGSCTPRDPCGATVGVHLRYHFGCSWYARLCYWLISVTAAW